MKKINLKSTICLTFLALVMLAGSMVSFAAVKLPDLSIPRYGAWASSRTFNVTNRGTLNVTVDVAVKGFLGSGGNSTYQVQLMKGNTIIRSKSITTNTTFRYLAFSETISCNQTGSYYFRVRNNLPANRQAGIAKFRTFNPPAPVTRSNNLARFGITQGQTETFDIPDTLVPQQPGRFTLTATWGSTCNLDPAGCKLRFQIVRNGQVLATSIWGYTYTTIFARSNQKLRLNYNVPINRVGGNWSLRVTASDIGDAANVIPRIQYTTGCQ
ncbi:MAG: hypothetical protein R2747_18515 [Pyrinomonadaceae bacterium]